MPDDLWDRLAPLLPPRPLWRRRYPGRLPADDRAAPRGIVYVPRTGVTWADVPTETIGSRGVTCWRRLRDWTEAGVWPRLHAILLTELRTADLLDIDDAASTARTSGPSKGSSHRTFAGRPRPLRQRAPLDHRPRRNTSRSVRDQRRPSRRHPVHAPAGHDPSHPRPGGPTPPPATPAVRRPWLRLRQVPTPCSAPVASRRGSPFTSDCSNSPAASSACADSGPHSEMITVSSTRSARQSSWPGRRVASSVRPRGIRPSKTSTTHWDGAGHGFELVP